jgi:hypothetical protein
MGTLKAAATMAGVTIGAGPVDPQDPGPIGTTEFGTPVPSGYSWAWPTVLNAATNRGADLIANDFGGAIDLCLWARGPLDLSHFGAPGRWLGPGSYDFTGPDAAYAWANANGLRTWISDPAYSGVPTWLSGGGYTPAQVSTMLHDWYTAVYSRYPLAYGTTFLNELYQPDPEYPPESDWNTYWYYSHGNVGSGIEDWEKILCGWVRAANANIKIIVNDANHSNDVGRAAGVRDWVLRLKAAGADIAGIGLQCHFQSTVGIDAAWRTNFTQCIQTLAGGGVGEVFITELDIKNDGANWANAYYQSVRGIIDSGVVETLNLWAARDPLWYGANGALYTASPDLAWTAARGAFEDALLAVPLGTTQPPLPIYRIRHAAIGLEVIPTDTATGIQTRLRPKE